MKTVIYSITNGCLPCVQESCDPLPMATGDKVRLPLDRVAIPTAPEFIEAEVTSVAIVGTVTTYGFIYDEVQLVGSGIAVLTQSLIKNFPVCRTKYNDLLDRVKLLEAAVFPV